LNAAAMSLVFASAGARSEPVVIMEASAIILSIATMNLVFISISCARE